ncbi:MAG: tetratricopeptide repeat protein [Sphingobacteriaceae bacterium]|nr:MAG: tetratricopeptide repeat protein [Sphingobacteriaceae bacterium]
MKLKGYLLLIVILLFADVSNAQQVNDSLFNKLNQILANKEVYIQQKQNRINSLRLQLAATTAPRDKYTLYQKLYEEYKTFSYDSSYTYAKHLQVTAKHLGDERLIASAKMRMAFTLLSSGLFKETLETLNSVNAKPLPDNDKVEYYFLKARSYFDLSDYNRNRDFSAIYDPKGIACIDSAIALSKPGSYNYLELKGLKDLRTGDYADGEKTYRALLAIRELTPHQFAINACCLSYIYETKGPHEKSVELLIRAAISDVESATKETVASYKLADVLFKKGDIEHAYIYIKQAMDEATFYGALHRQVKISAILPIIEAQWINQIERQKTILYIYSAIITLLVVAVVVFAVIIFRQLKKIRIADKIIQEANINLQESNRTLEEVNKKLSVANTIKNEYIGYYFNINSIYIDKLENFKKSLDKKLASKRYEDAIQAVNNLNLEAERSELFHTFDKVFLRLFPDFIERFNSFFKPEDKMVIPKDELLNTELRIFALIRMGIHDNDRISKILGYSVNTIYSYKNRIKTRSVIPNDEFEDRIMDIEAV